MQKYTIYVIYFVWQPTYCLESPLYHFAWSPYNPLYIKCCFSSDSCMKKGLALVLKWSAPSVNMSSCSDTCQCPDSRGAVTWPALPPAWIFINMCHLVCWWLRTFATGSTIGSDHSSRFTSAGQYASTADQFLSAGSVTTFHILLPHIPDWPAFSSLWDQDR